MDDYCSNSITFVSKNKKMLKCFWKALRDDLLKDRPCRIIDVLKNFGYKDNVIFNKLKVDSRDKLVDMDIYIKGEDGYDCYFSIRTETFCGPHTEMWLDLMKRRYGGNIQLYYQSESLDVGIFRSNDSSNRYYPVQYVVDYDIHGILKGKRYFADIKELQKYIKRKFQVDVDDTCCVATMQKLVEQKANLGVEQGYINIVEVDYDANMAVA